MLIVSIPQAVGTIAIHMQGERAETSGVVVSIPQAVGTIAIKRVRAMQEKYHILFQYRKR